MGKRLELESTAPFQGLPELVAYDEGLFAAEGLDVVFVGRGAQAPKQADRSVTDAALVDPFASHGSSLEAGGAAMFNACEWGNFNRVANSASGGRQLGRRAIVAHGAIVVAPGSPVYTPQQLAHVPVGVSYHAGPHYLALLMLEGFLPREAIATCLAPNGAIRRFRALLSGELDATVLTEPHISLAEQAGCRVILEAPFHGTEVATADVDAETYRAFNRAVGEAVRRINANKRRYLQYFLDYHRDEPEIAGLSVDDLPPSRLVVMAPTPIPEDEALRTSAWMRSWGLLPDIGYTELCDVERQRAAHAV